MARGAARKPANKDLVAKYVTRLKDAGSDRAAFDRVVGAIEAETEASAAEIIAIGNAYAVGGIKATSKKAALERIRKRFVEIVRAKGNAEIAARSRPW